MKKKIIFSLSLLIFTGLIALVYAATSRQTVELKIYKGWNLVSFGIIETGEDTTTTCSPQDLIVLYGYDPLGKRYVKIKDVTEVSRNVSILDSVREFYKETNTYLTRSTINSGWLYSTKDCEIAELVPLNFTLEYIQPMGLMGLKFPAGWNFFTVLLDMVGKSIDDIKGDCVIEKTYIWNPEDQIWMNIKNLKFAETLPAYGFVFKTSNDCLLGESTTIPEAPALPE